MAQKFPMTISAGARWRNAPDLVPGATSYAFPFRTITDAYRLEERLRVLEESEADKILVAIVGAGLQRRRTGL